MESISSIITYPTDTSGSWSIGQEQLPISQPFLDVLLYAISIQAKVIVKTSRGKYWYIKGINNNKPYSVIKSQLEENQQSQYRPRSRSWLISYT